MRRFNDLADFSREEIKELIALAARLDAKPEPRALEGKVLSLLFLSPSLRTLSSFQAAMLRLGGGSFVLYSRTVLRELIDLCHAHGVYVSTGGFIEHVLGQGSEADDAYLREAKDLGFDVIELSSGFITMPFDDWLRLVERVQRAGLKAKPEIGIRFGAGGASQECETDARDTHDPEWLIEQGRRFLDAGVELLMIESEGLTEQVTTWRTDVIARIASGLGLERVMFEAADPAVFNWYVETYGPFVNLFVDHSQIVQLEALRLGLWGTADVWGRVTTFQPPEP